MKPTFEKFDTCSALSISPFSAKLNIAFAPLATYFKPLQDKLKSKSPSPSKLQSCYILSKSTKMIFLPIIQKCNSQPWSNRTILSPIIMSKSFLHRIFFVTGLEQLSEIDAIFLSSFLAGLVFYLLPLTPLTSSL